jgi:hypothetical protein
MTVTVLMKSAEYGAEEFAYETVAEALEGMKRLAKTAREAREQDDIEREIVLLSPFDGTEAEGETVEDIYAALRDVRRRIEAAGLQDDLDQTYNFLSDPLYEPEYGKV